MFYSNSQFNRAPELRGHSHLKNNNDFVLLISNNSVLINNLENALMINWIPIQRLTLKN